MQVITCIYASKHLRYLDFNCIFVCKFKYFKLKMQAFMCITEEKNKKISINWAEIAESIRARYKKLTLKQQKTLRFNIYNIYGIAENTLWQKFEGKLKFKPVEIEVIDRFMKNY